MRIAIIGCQRSRSTALQHYILELYPNLEDLFNYYTLHYDYNNDKIKTINLLKYNQFVKAKLQKISTELFARDDFVIKISGSMFDQYFDHPFCLNLEKYDKLYLIERHDFFDACCSFQIAKQENVWFSMDAPEHNKLHPLGKYFQEVYDQKISQKNYTIKFEYVYSYMWDIVNYLKIKRYLLDNNISHDQYEYNNEIFKTGRKIGMIKEVKLNYENKITNYHHKEKVNKVFNRYFNYENCLFNFKDCFENIKLILQS